MFKSKVAKSVINRLLAVTILSAILLMVVLGSALAIEIPPSGSVIFIQTNGPSTPIDFGDWYTSDANGAVPGYHYVEIIIPCGWPDTTPIQVDLFSPQMVSSDIRDEDTNLIPFTTTFELYGPYVPGVQVIGPLPDQPAAGGGFENSDYPPVTDPAATSNWDRFYTFDPPVCGSYVLRVESRDDDENAWRLRVGWDDDDDPNNSPPANSDDFDGIAGTDDEILAGVTQVAYQHPSDEPQCLTLYEFVEPGSPSVTFHNFDLDNNLRVRYYAPSDAYDPTAQSGGTVGTVSGGTVWNNGTLDRGAGDTIDNPEAGWWRIVTCAVDFNQFIQEGQFGVPAFLAQPPVPDMVVEKDDGQTVVLANQLLTYTLRFTNTSDTTTSNPGAALNVSLTDNIPTNTTYVAGSCMIDLPYTGSCDHSSGVVTFNINETVNAGDSGQVQFVVQVNSDAAGTVSNTVSLDYEDSFGNQFPPATDDDVDNIPSFNLLIDKTDGGITTVAGGVISYTISYTNINTGPIVVNATGVVITDTVPANTTFNAGSSTAGWSCSDGDPAGTVCSYDVGTLNGGASGSVVFAVNVDDPLPMGVDEILNSATISDDGTHGPEPKDDNTANETTPTTAAIVDPGITKVADVSQARPGDLVNFSITIFNPAPPSNVSATGVTITDPLPQELEYVSHSVSSSPPGVAVDGDVTVVSETISTITLYTVTVDVGDLGLNEVVTLNLRTRVTDLASPPPLDILNPANLDFNEGPRKSDSATVNVPSPTSPPQPPSGGGGGDDDDDDDKAPTPTPAPSAPSVQPTPTLPVLFLPETGLREWQPADSKVGWVLLGLLGVALLALVVWQKGKLR